jgi:hypothetical protein
MSMLTLNGSVANVFDTPQGKNRETGEVIESRPRVQIMAENTLQNGQKRMELVTMTVDAPEDYRKLLGASVRVPVGVFATGGTVMYYALKGHKPERIPESSR